MDRVFGALAHPVRRRILDRLAAAPGSTVASLSPAFDMSAVALLKHVKILKEAGLIVWEKSGREVWLYFNVVPIQSIHDRWTDQYAQFWAERLVDMKGRVERRDGKQTGKAVKCA